PTDHVQAAPSPVASCGATSMPSGSCPTPEYVASRVRYPRASGSLRTTSSGTTSATACASLKDCPSGHRRLSLTLGAPKLVPHRRPSFVPSAPRTAEAVRPSQTAQIFSTGRLRREPFAELLQRSGIVDPADGMGSRAAHHNILRLRERSGYPFYLIHKSGRIWHCRL